ncbi:MAG: YlbL family protein [Actinomycetota bacterium]
MGAGRVRLLLGAALAGTVMVTLSTVALPLVTIHPGPALNATRFVKIEAPTYPSKGSIHLTTVSLFDANLWDGLRGWLSPSIAVYPRSAFYPSGLSEEEVIRENVAEMDTSEIAATVAALSELGFRLEADGALVRATDPGTPADRKLQPGDVIVDVDGSPVSTPAEVRSAIGRRRVGETVEVSVMRAGERKWFPMKAAAAPTRGGRRVVIGTELLPNFRLPFNVTIDVGEVGGPSAGLAFALAVVDLLDPMDLTHGRIIADTGTIDFEGKVGIVGGIQQKAQGAARLGASLFLVPKEQQEEARAQAGARMRVIGVSSLHEAVEILRGLDEGRGFGAGTAGRNPTGRSSKLPA